MDDWPSAEAMEHGPGGAAVPDWDRPNATGHRSSDAELVAPTRRPLPPPSAPPPRLVPAERRSEAERYEAERAARPEPSTARGRRKEPAPTAAPGRRSPWMVAFTWLWAAALMAGAGLVVVDRQRTPAQLVPAVPVTEPPPAAMGAGDPGDDPIVARSEAFAVESAPTASTLVFE